MTYNDAMKAIQMGEKVRRPCWQPGWVELGLHQNKLVAFYCNPADVMISDHVMPAMLVTYTAFKAIKTDPRTGEQFLYPEDERAKDWEIVK